MDNSLYMTQNPSQYGMNPQQTSMNNYSNSMPTYQRPADVVDYVNGFNGMMNYPIPNGRTGILFDFPNRKFWIKSPGGPQPVLGFTFNPDNYPMNNQMVSQSQQSQIQQPENDAVSREEFNQAINSLGSDMAKIQELLTSLQQTNADNSQRQSNKKYNNQKG